MSQAPSMPMFWDAYLADTTHLSTEEHGAYLLLLAAMWRRNGWVPDDDRDNARILGLTVAKWKRTKARLEPFLLFEDGQISQKNLLKIWENTQEKIDKNRENGAKGGRPKSRENSNLAKPNGSVSDNPNKTIPEPEPEPYKKPPNPQNGGTDLFSAEEDPPPKPKPIDILSEVIPKGLAEDFIEHRKSLKKPLTDLAAKRIVSELRTFSNPAASIDASIRNGWAGVFAPKDSNGKAIRPASKDPTVLRALANAGGAR